MLNKKRGIRLIFNNRKGISHDLFFNVFELILAFIVILALFNFVNDIAEQTLFKRNYLARDISLLINALYASPASDAVVTTMDYKYDEDMKKFTLEFSEGRISIYEEGKEDVMTFYLFGEDKTAEFSEYPIFTFGEEATRLNFIKSPSSMDVKK